MSSSSTALPYIPGIRSSGGGSPDPTPTPPSTGVTLTAQQLADETGAELSRAERVLAVATQVITEYAPNAPEVIANEAVIRFGGYLLEAGYGAVRVTELGPQKIEATTNHAPAFRNSGAMGLLTRYKRRRAGIIR